MKKYLQACETGGSIYGKARPSGKKNSAVDNRTGREDLISSYSKLYRKQVIAMHRIFQRGQ